VRTTPDAAAFAFVNSTGEFNNAVGAKFVAFQTDGDSNNALGESALFGNSSALPTRPSAMSRS
jgi:hypothetical protein